MITTSAQEGGVLAHVLHYLEAEHVAIEGDRPMEIGHFEVDVADSNFRVNGSVSRYWFHPLNRTPNGAVQRRRASVVRCNRMLADENANARSSQSLRRFVGIRRARANRRLLLQRSCVIYQDLCCRPAHPTVLDPARVGRILLLRIGMEVENDWD